MFTMSGSPAAVSSLPAWNILFAREPEPDMELDETTADLEETAPLDDDDGGEPQGPEDDKKQKIIKLALLALAAGAGLYLAMDPSILTGPSEEPPPAAAPAAPKAAQAPAAQPKPAAPPTSVAPPPAAQAPSPAQAPQAMPTAPVAPAPAQPKSPMPAMASAPSPAMPSAIPPAQPKPASTASTGASAGLSPLFSEGQHVVVLPDPAKPNGPVALMADAGNSRPGPTVAANATATVVDGELRNNSWVYTIRTPQGATGWISEKQLQAKP